jgi:glyoxylase-like metal-dependent hydrolase (beta-lactamase superfamily II)
MNHFVLPPGIQIFERGWLSANNILLYGNGDVSLVDTGYCAHQDLTLELVKNALQTHGLFSLNKIVNTHLHSDHCGGNAALLNTYHPEIYIPAAEAYAVSCWDEDLLSYRNLGQECPRFSHTHVLLPGSEVILGLYPWQVLAAPGHDPHSIMLYQADHQILISADALWEDGFGVIFPELWGESGFEEVGQTLDLIEGLNIALVIPGHGKPFTDAPKALKVARSRLDYLAAEPDRNARHGAKVLLKYKLLEWRSIELQKVSLWISKTPALIDAAKQLNMEVEEMAIWLPQALVKSHAAKIEQEHLINLD